MVEGREERRREKGWISQGSSNSGKRKEEAFIALEITSSVVGGVIRVEVVAEVTFAAAGVVSFFCVCSGVEAVTVDFGDATTAAESKGIFAPDVRD